MSAHRRPSLLARARATAAAWRTWDQRQPSLRDRLAGRAALSPAEAWLREDGTVALVPAGGHLDLAVLDPRRRIVGHALPPWHVDAAPDHSERHLGRPYVTAATSTPRGGCDPDAEQATAGDSPAPGVPTYRTK